jgi:hypothetical protein
MSTNNKVSGMSTSQGEPKQKQPHFAFKANQLIWLYFGSLEALIALRIGLKLLGANPENPIVALIYGFTSLFIVVGWISSPTVGSMVLELASVFAMLIYALLAWAMERAIWLLFSRPRHPATGVADITTSEHPVSP